MQPKLLTAAMLALAALVPAQGFQRSSPAAGGSRGISSPQGPSHSAPRSAPSPSRSMPSPSRSAPAPRSSSGPSRGFDAPRSAPSPGRTPTIPTTRDYSPPSRSMPSRPDYGSRTPRYDPPSSQPPRSRSPVYVPPSRSQPPADSPRYEPTPGDSIGAGGSPRYEPPVRIRVGGDDRAAPPDSSPPVRTRYQPPGASPSPIEPRRMLRDRYVSSPRPDRGDSISAGRRTSDAPAPGVDRQLRDQLSERYRGRYESDVRRGEPGGPGRPDLPAPGDRIRSDAPGRPGGPDAGQPKAGPEIGGHRYANPSRPTPPRSGDAPRPGPGAGADRPRDGRPVSGGGLRPGAGPSPSPGARISTPSLGPTRTAKRVFSGGGSDRTFQSGGYWGSWHSYCNYSSFCWGYGWNCGWYGPSYCSWGIYGMPFYWCWSWPSWYWDYRCSYAWYWNSCYPYRNWYAPVWGAAWWYDPYWSSSVGTSYVTVHDVEYVPVTTEAIRAGEKPSPESLARKYVALGDFYFREGRFQEAADNYLKALTWIPEDASLHFVLADALFALGDYHYAAYVIRKALRLDPGLARAATDKREFYGDGKLFDAQLATLRKYLDEKPYDAAAHLVLAYNLRFSGDPKGAEAALRRVLEIEPKDEAAALLLAEMPAAAPKKEPAAK